jgi:hypothetical protein
MHFMVGNLNIVPHGIMLPLLAPVALLFLECQAFGLLVCNISNSMEVSHLFLVLIRG